MSTLTNSITRWALFGSATLQRILETEATQECAKSTSSRQRLLFIDICNYILDIFSRGFFKDNFFEAVLELAHDPVSNVRLRLCHILPSLKSILKLPGDRVLLQQLELMVRKLISQERDHDACFAIREAVVEMDKIEIAMETLTRRTFFEADLTDQEREEEERALLLAEEKEREKQAKKTGKGGKTGQSPRETRKGSSTSLATSGSTACANSPAPAHKRKSPSLSVTKSLSAPPTTGPEVGGASERKACNSPIHFTVPSSQNKPPLRQRSVSDKKVSPMSSPSPSHPSKPSPPKPGSANNSSSSRLTTAKSKDSLSNKSTSPAAARRKPGSSSSSSATAQQYGLAYSRTSSGRKS